MKHSLNALAARRVLSRRISAPARAVLGRGFSTGARCRVIVYYSPNRISWSQVYPFVHYEAELARLHGAELRFVPFGALLQTPDLVQRPADIILVQPWFTVDPRRLEQVLDRMAEAHPRARISFLDSYAHNDLRLAGAVDPYIVHYLKKSLFRDRSLYFEDFRGDTNLVDFYGRLYGQDHAPVQWHVPRSILPKLRLSPNFLTAPHFIAPLETDEKPRYEGRSLDVTVRLGGLKGEGSYPAMRRHAHQVMTDMVGISQSPPGAVPLAAYMAEMRAARLCFSPFGFGELCWRDIEAILSGAVMIKPDMGHLETLPDLYEPGVTYLPVRWDFSDLEDVVCAALADEACCAEISRAAYERMADYIRKQQFAADMSFLFT